GDKGRALMAEIHRWKGITLAEMPEQKPDPTALVENLNRLMFSPDMLAKIPDDVRHRADAGQLEAQLQTRLGAADDREFDETALLLKRRLLETYYDLPV